uniref:Transposase IS200 like n=1 Tax=Candidatus Kentrum sp. UNK TaxID=2126344 RepID=A0A451AJC8_9GAMM|nr:MAG: Transposase IS200 like [Candidatus Kentron sp. UNK]
MPQSLSSLYVHSVFSVKNRNPFLKDAEIRRETRVFPGGVAKKLECPPIIVGGTEDHVHLLCRSSRIISQADYVKELKRVSTIWIKKREPALVTFAWQRGYGVFSVSLARLIAATKTKVCHFERKREIFCLKSRLGAQDFSLRSK